MNRLCLSSDRYTQEHATEAIAELLTLPEIQEHYMAVCEIGTLSSVLVNAASDKARHEALNGLSYLAESKHIEQVHIFYCLLSTVTHRCVKMSQVVVDDIISFIDSTDVIKDKGIRLHILIPVYANLPMCNNITL